MRTTAYKEGGGGGGGGGGRVTARVQGCVRAQKKFFCISKSQNVYFLVQKKLLHCHLLLCIENCKPALSYK